MVTLGVGLRVTHTWFNASWCRSEINVARCAVKRTSSSSTLNNTSFLQIAAPSCVSSLPEQSLPELSLLELSLLELSLPELSLPELSAAPSLICGKKGAMRTPVHGWIDRWVLATAASVVRGYRAPGNLWVVLRIHIP